MLIMMLIFANFLSHILTVYLLSEIVGIFSLNMLSLVCYLWLLFTVLTVTNVRYVSTENIIRGVFTITQYTFPIIILPLAAYMGIVLMVDSISIVGGIVLAILGSICGFGALTNSSFLMGLLLGQIFKSTWKVN